MNFERKFVAGKEGVVEEKLTEEEKEKLNKPKERRILSLGKDRKFSVGPDGTTEILGSDEEKLQFKKKI